MIIHALLVCKSNILTVFLLLLQQQTNPLTIPTHIQQTFVQALSHPMREIVTTLSDIPIMIALPLQHQNHCQSLWNRKPSLLRRTAFPHPTNQSVHLIKTKHCNQRSAPRLMIVVDSKTLTAKPHPSLLQRYRHHCLQSQLVSMEQRNLLLQPPRQK